MFGLWRLAGYCCDEVAELRQWSSELVRNLQLSKNESASITREQQPFVCLEKVALFERRSRTLTPVMRMNISDHDKLVQIFIEQQM